MLVAVLVGGCKSQPTTYDELPLIPLPKEVGQLQGAFTLNAQTTITAPDNDAEVQGIVAFLSDLIEPSTGFKLKKSGADDAENIIVLKIDTAITGNQGVYRLTISNQRVDISAPDAIGLFYGVQTFRQLLPPEVEARSIQTNVEWSAPAVVISDEPRFSYRGLHLDVGRHFFPVSFIKKFIDLLALHKMNKFHWHLTEDQGWRLEIKKYPKLQEIASQREETLIGHGGITPYEFDGTPYGGYYTQEEAREVVKYAADRFITIIPEIEMPGHALAALAAYPELGCIGGGPYKVATSWGVFDDIFCAGQEKTFEFLENVLLEVMDIFPSEYIHIGGDEAPKTRWEECPRCQARIRKEGLKDEHELQSYFIKRIEKFLHQHGRKIIGWDEILEGGLAPDATVMSWRGIAGGEEAARQGHDVIMTPNSFVYLDHYQNDPKDEPLAIGGFLPLEKVYSFNPIPDSFTLQEGKHILGVQGNLWTEYMKTSDQVEYMAYPRASAIAEIGWTPQAERNFDSFLVRLEQFYKRLDILDVNYFYAIPKPETKNTKIGFTDKTTITLKVPLPGSEVRFTTDGSDPSTTSQLYKRPIKVTETSRIKAITVKKNGETSAPLVISVNKIEYTEPAANLNPTENGMSYQYFPAFFKSVKEMNDKTPAAAGTVTSGFIPRVADAPAFGLILEGFFKAEKEGLYHFHLSSDDGSILYLGDKELIDNDGLHSNQTESGSAALRKGFYPFKIMFAEGGGGYNLEVEVEMPDGETRKLTAADFRIQ